jgi:heme exporter protein D
MGDRTGGVQAMSEFLAMNGYAFYIWGSYGMTLIIFIVETALVRHKRTLTLQQLRLMRDTAE